MLKGQVTAAVEEGSTGCYMIRPSSVDTQLVLVVNDHGKAVNFPIIKEAAGGFSFAGETYAYVDDLIDYLQANDLTSKTGNANFKLTQPANGGELGTALRTAAAAS